MRLVLQRVSSASVAVDDEVVASVGAGLVVLAAVGRDDTEAGARHLATRVAALRIFADEAPRMKRCLIDVAGAALVVSQFTLYADTSRGSRPSFLAAARPELAVAVLAAFTEQLRSLGVEVGEGRFGAHMEVALVNDGPVTIILEG